MEDTRSEYGGQRGHQERPRYTGLVPTMVGVCPTDRGVVGRPSRTRQTETSSSRRTRVPGGRRTPPRFSSEREGCPSPPLPCRTGTLGRLTLPKHFVCLSGGPPTGGEGGAFEESLRVSGRSTETEGGRVKGRCPSVTTTSTQPLLD